MFVHTCYIPFCLFQVDDVRDTFRSILQMSLVLTYGGSVPVVKVRGRVFSFVLFATWTGKK